MRLRSLRVPSPSQSRERDRGLECQPASLPAHLCLRANSCALPRRAAHWTNLLPALRQNHELIWALARKELMVRYKRSALGFLWALLNPLLTMAILALVFSLLMRFSIEHYSVFLISALLPWTFFAQSLAYSAESVVGNGELLKKVYVEKTVFPIAAVLSNLVNFALSFIPLAFLLVVLGHPLHITWVYLPAAVLALTMFTLGCGFVVAASNVFFRDVAHILQVVLSILFYFSPILYSLDLIPQQYRYIFRLNPVLYLLEGFRDAIYSGVLPSLASTALALGIGVAALLIGYVIFRRYQESFVFYV
jgi:lipopolysaccharide transport system permease protein